MIDDSAISGEVLSYLIWGGMGLVWLLLSAVLLRRLRMAQRPAQRAILWLAGVIAVTAPAAMIWAYVAIFALSFGTYGPEGMVGTGGPVLLFGAVMGGVTGAVVATLCATWRRGVRA